MEAIIDDFTEENKVSYDAKYWNYKEEKTLIGVVVEIDDSKDDLSVEVSINEKGETVTLPNLVTLREFVKELTVGDKIKLVHTGSKKPVSGGRNYETFEMYKKKQLE